MLQLDASVGLAGARLVLLNLVTVSLYCFGLVSTRFVLGLPFWWLGSDTRRRA